jgi:hypothetical protein
MKRINGLISGPVNLRNSGAACRENAEVCLNVIAGAF